MNSKRNTLNRNQPPKAPEPEATQIVVRTRTQENETPQPMERIGDTLRRERERRGDDLSHVAEYLCIKPSFLIALENNRYETFAADAYVIGFLRSYASYLGLDGKTAIDRYRHEMAGRRNKPILTMPTPVTEGRSPSGIVIAAALLAAFLIYAVWYGISSSDRTPTQPTALSSGSVVETTIHTESATSPTTSGSTAAPVPTAQGAAPLAPGLSDIKHSLTPAKPADVATSPAPLSSSLPKTTPLVTSSPIVIHAIQPSWIFISDSTGKTIYDHVLKAGEDYKIPDTKGLYLTTGNVSGLTLTSNGNALPKLPSPSDSTHVLRDVPIDSFRVSSPNNQTE